MEIRKLSCCVAGSRAKGEELCHVQPRWLEATGSTVELAVISNVGANLCKVFLQEASQFSVIISVNVILRACSFVASGGIPVAMAEEKDIAEREARCDSTKALRAGSPVPSLVAMPRSSPVPSLCYECLSHHACL